MGKNEYNDKPFLELIYILLDHFIDRYAEVQSRYKNHPITYSHFGSRGYISRLIDQVLRYDPDFYKVILEKYKTEKIIKSNRKENSRSVLSQLLHIDSKIENYTDHYDEDEGYIATKNAEETIVGIVLSAIDRTMLKEGHIDKRAISANIQNVIADINTLLDGEAIEEDYLIGFAGFKTEEDVVVHFGDAVASPFNKSQSSYFFHQENIGLVARIKVLRKNGSVRLQSKRAESESDKLDFTSSIKKLAYEAQLALILTLSKEEEPFYAVIDGDCMLHVDGSIQRFIAYSSYYGHKTQKTQLTKKMAKKVSIKYLIITDRDLSSIKIAVNRLLKAICDRDDPDDVLLDAIMCWENIIGTENGGETVFRVCAATARLLSKKENDIKDLYEKMKAIYRDRSRLIHGNEKYKQDTTRIKQAVFYAVKLIDAVIENEEFLNKSSEERNEMAFSIQ